LFDWVVKYFPVLRQVLLLNGVNNVLKQRKWIIAFLFSLFHLW